MPPVGLKLLHPLKSNSYPITQRFGENPQWYPNTNGHNGIDYGIPLRTSVFATLAGKVVRVASDKNGYGNHVRIQHAGNLLSIYAHLDEKNWTNVQEGQEVPVGWEVGFSGNTGRSTGPHLHFEVREGTQAFDPAPYIVTSLGDVVVDHEEEEEEGQAVEGAIFRVRVTADPSLNIRSGPSIVYPTIGSLANGETIDVLEIGGTEVWVRTAKGYIAFRYNGTNLVEIA